MRILIILIITLALLGSSAAAYIRDADISASEDCVGIGYANGIMLFGEKVLEDKKSSFGTMFVPLISYGGKEFISSLWEMSYNKLLSKKDDSTLSAVFGIAGYLEETPDIDGEVSDYKIMPEIGVVISLKHDKRVSSRFRLVLGPLFGYELGYRFLENTEVSIGIGLPLVSVKVIHHFAEPAPKRPPE